VTSDLTQNGVMDLLVFEGGAVLTEVGRVRLPDPMLRISAGDGAAYFGNGRDRRGPVGFTVDLAGCR
jgi:hypothetical protein